VSDSSPLTSQCDAVLAPRLEQRILPGLDRMHRALAELGHPERAFRAALVVGTNGKGSTAALLASILQRHGVRVGLYTSPHLVHVEERIVVSGRPIEPGRLLELIAGLAAFPSLSYFETLTVAAFRHFAEIGVEVAVLEAGLGGRWDATNAADPDVALLGNVGTDHQVWLGATRTEIAAEKAAALRGREAIVGAWDGEVAPVIRATADPTTPLSLASDWASVEVESRESGVESSPAHPAHSDVEEGTSRLSILNPQPAVQRVSFRIGDQSGRADLPLLGGHQLANLTLALAGAAALAKHGIVPRLRAEAISAGIAATAWPGRLQWVEWRGRRLLLDGAHNREAVLALAAALDALGLSGNVNLVFSCLDDKPLAAMAEVLRPCVADVLVAALESPRATPIAALETAFPGCTTCASVAAALDQAPVGAPTLVTGSLRLVGEVLRLIGARGSR
jgi:dihydrofolate synthase / folylpolyglutamate synthase